MVGVALIGAGIFAKEAHVPALVENKASLLAIYSRSTTSANSLVEAVNKAGGSTSQIDVYSDEKPQHDLDTLLQRQDITAVVIVLPILVQPDIVRKCLKAGKHVICEKPIAKDVKSASELITDYETSYAPHGLIFSVAEQFRYDRAYTKAREIVASGEIGKITHAHARMWSFVRPGTKYYETAWRKTPEYQGGFILDGGVHSVALLRHVSGLEVVETKGFATQTQSHLPPVDTVNAALRFDNGACGSLDISFGSSKRAFEFTFIGTEGSVIVTGLAGRVGMTKLVIETEGGQKSREEVIEGKGLYEEIKAFLEAVASGKADKAGSPREALADVAVIESVCAGGGPIKSCDGPLV